MRSWTFKTAPARWATTVAAAIILVASGCTKSPNTSSNGGIARLNGGGSTFVGPIMKKWATLYQEKKGVEVDYALKGSGNGIQQMTAKTYHFGCTDAPMNEDELKKAKETGGDVLHIPLIFGAVVPIYNVPELKDAKEPLKFTGAILADIFMGKITKWNDAALQMVNPGVGLPDRAIVVVRRADPSGTTFIWTSYLAAVSEPWKKEIGPGAKEVNWWTGAVGKPQNQGVAGHVAGSEGAIGYVEMDYALSNKLPFGAVQNKEAKFVVANTEAVTAAAKGAEENIPDNLCFSLNNQPGEKAYPICGTVWAVLYANQPAGNGKSLVDFLTWCTHDGQKYAAELNYAPLSEGLVHKIEEKLKLVKFTQ
jgi:phosphate ABC transporter phosphate-binding protein